MSAPSSSVPTLATPRLRLTPLDPLRDREAYFQLLSDADVMRYLGDEPFTSIEQADAALNVIALRCAAGDNFDWAVRLADPTNNTLYGRVRLDCDLKRRRGEVGYSLAPAFWGQGLGKEAVRAVLDFAFDHMNLNRIEALAFAENTASHALLRSLGFRQEGVLRDHAWEKGRFWDDLIFGLLRREWEVALRDE